jgi:hypothetical protein
MKPEIMHRRDFFQPHAEWLHSAVKKERSRVQLPT